MTTELETLRNILFQILTACMWNCNMLYHVKLCQCDSLVSSWISWPKNNIKNVLNKPFKHITESVNISQNLFLFTVFSAYEDACQHLKNVTLLHHSWVRLLLLWFQSGWFFLIGISSSVFSYSFFVICLTSEFCVYLQTNKQCISSKQSRITLNRLFQIRDNNNNNYLTNLWINIDDVKNSRRNYQFCPSLSGTLILKNTDVQRKMRVFQILFYHFVYFALRYLPQKSQTQHSFTQFAKSPIKYTKGSESRCIHWKGTYEGTYQISPRDSHTWITLSNLLIGEVP